MHIKKEHGYGNSNEQENNQNTIIINIWWWWYYWYGWYYYCHYDICLMGKIFTEDTFFLMCGFCLCSVVVLFLIFLYVFFISFVLKMKKNKFMVYYDSYYGGDGCFHSNVIKISVMMIIVTTQNGSNGSNRGYCMIFYYVFGKDKKLLQVMLIMVVHLKMILKGVQENKECNAGAVEKVTKKHELTRKPKMRVDTNRDQTGKEAFAVDLDASAEDVHNGSGDSYGASVQQINSFTDLTCMEISVLFDNECTTTCVFLITNNLLGFLHNTTLFVGAVDVENIIFDLFILMCVLLAMDNLRVVTKDRCKDLKKALKIYDWIFTVIFILDALLNEPQNISGPLTKGTRVKQNSTYPSMGSENGSNDNDIDNNTNHNIDDAEDEIRLCKNAHLKSWWNRLDFAIVIAAMLDLILPLGILLVLIVTLFLFLLDVLRVQLFGDTMDKPDDSLWYSMILMMQLFSADALRLVMGNTIVEQGDAVTKLALYIFQNICLEILIKRLSNQDNIQLMIDVLLALAAKKQSLYKKDEKTGITESNWMQNVYDKNVWDSKLRNMIHVSKNGNTK